MCVVTMAPTHRGEGGLKKKLSRIFFAREWLRDTHAHPFTVCTFTFTKHTVTSGNPGLVVCLVCLGRSNSTGGSVPPSPIKEGSIHDVILSQFEGQGGAPGGPEFDGPGERPRGLKGV